MLPGMRVRRWEARATGRWSGLDTADQAILVMVRFAFSVDHLRSSVEQESDHPLVRVPVRVVLHHPAEALLPVGSALVFRKPDRREVTWNDRTEVVRERE